VIRPIVLIRPMQIAFAPTPHEEAIALIRRKPAVSREVFDQLLPELRGRAFTITGVEGATVLQRVRDTIAALPQGGEGNTWDKLREQVAEELDPYLGDGAEARATLLMRTHGFQAFQAANWRVAQEDADTTHLQYLATEDDHVRDSHLALNGLILPKDDPFWQDHYPPWEWGCRCRVRPMNPDLMDEARADDTGRNPEDRLVIEGPALDQLRDGTLIRAGRRYDVTAPADSSDSSYAWDPADLRIPLAELEARYDPPVWAAFRALAEATRVGRTTLWRWLSRNVRSEIVQNPNKSGSK
jgi:SPP1 gp7 family putative phage head morphogenesis protein